MSCTISGYIPSTTPGRRWHLSAGPGGASAMEVIPGDVEGGAVFTCELLPSSIRRLPIQKPATKKRKIAALGELRRQLVQEGLSPAPEAKAAA